MWNVIIADSDIMNLFHLTNVFEQSDTVHLLNCVTTLEQLVAEVREYLPDSLCVDVSILDGTEDCMQLFSSLGSVTNIILTAEDDQQALPYTSIVSCNQYILLKPYAPEAIPRALNIMSHPVQRQVAELLPLVSKYVLKIGVPPHLDGYKFLREAIVLYLTEGTRISDIYTSLALKYNKNVHCIERSMRNAIENAWGNGNIDFINSVFGYTVSPDSGKPANREFIALVADKIRYLTNSK